MTLTTTRPLNRRQATYRAHWQHVMGDCWACDRNLPCNVEDRLYQERRAAEVADDDESAA